MKILIDANLFVYMNTAQPRDEQILCSEFYADLASTHQCFVNPLILEELLYVSYWKYRVPYSKTHEFIERVVLSSSDLLPLGPKEVQLWAGIQDRYPLKPANALHLASMLVNDIHTIASEDHAFDRIDGISRLWLPGSR